MQLMTSVTLTTISLGLSLKLSIAALCKILVAKDSIFHTTSEQFLKHCMSWRIQILVKLYQWHPCCTLG